jgi:hypothetical protein
MLNAPARLSMVVAVSEAIAVEAVTGMTTVVGNVIAWAANEIWPLPPKPPDSSTITVAPVALRLIPGRPWIAMPSVRSAVRATGAAFATPAKATAPSSNNTASFFIA